MPLGSEAAQVILAEVYAEKVRWGVHDYPNGTGSLPARYINRARLHHGVAKSAKVLSWNEVLLKALYEALAEEDPVKLRARLIHCAAVIVAWIECIDRKSV